MFNIEAKKYKLTNLIFVRFLRADFSLSCHSPIGAERNCLLYRCKSYINVLHLMAPKHKGVTIYLILIFLTAGKIAAVMSVLRWTAIWLMLISSGGWITKMPPGNPKFRAIDRHLINVLHNNIKKNHLSQWFIIGGRHPGGLYWRIETALIDICIIMYFHKYGFSQASLSEIISGDFTLQLIQLMNKNIVSNFHNSSWMIFILVFNIKYLLTARSWCKCGSKNWISCGSCKSSCSTFWRDCSYLFCKTAIWRQWVEFILKFHQVYAIYFHKQLSKRKPRKYASIVYLNS